MTSRLSPSVVALLLLLLLPVARLGAATHRSSTAYPPPVSPLVGLLPAPPAGWWAEEANAESVAVPGGWTESAASRSYAQRPATDAPSVQVTVRDVGSSDAGRAALRAGVDDACTRFGDACRKTGGNGWTGFAAEIPESHAAELRALVADRYVIELAGTHVAQGELERWLERMPLDRLAPASTSP